LVLLINSAKQKKILLTGFGKFHRYDENPSQLIAHDLNQLNINNHQIHSCVLPVSFSNIEEHILDAIKQVKPDIIILLGLSFNRDYISLERRAQNLMKDRRKDNDGAVYDIAQKIDDDSQEDLWTSVDLVSLQEKLNNDHDLKIKTSTDAGTYVCNYGFYTCLNKTKIPNFFVHIPPHKDIKDELSFPLEQIKERITHVIDQLTLSSSDIKLISP
jgi:pyroglutamyl-peptidase